MRANNQEIPMAPVSAWDVQHALDFMAAKDAHRTYKPRSAKPLEPHSRYAERVGASAETRLPARFAPVSPGSKTLRDRPCST